MVEPYKILEEKMTMWFDNAASNESHSSLLTGKKSHQHRDDSNGGMLGKYDIYTSLTVSRDFFY